MVRDYHSGFSEPLMKGEQREGKAGLGRGCWEAAGPRRSRLRVRPRSATMISCGPPWSATGELRQRWAAVPRAGQGRRGVSKRHHQPDLRSLPTPTTPNPLEQTDFISWARRPAVRSSFGEATPSRTSIFKDRESAIYVGHDPDVECYYTAWSYLHTDTTESL